MNLEALIPPQQPELTPEERERRIAVYAARHAAGLQLFEDAPVPEDLPEATGKPGRPTIPLVSCGQCRRKLRKENLRYGLCHQCRPRGKRVKLCPLCGKANPHNAFSDVCAACRQLRATGVLSQ